MYAARASRQRRHGDVHPRRLLWSCAACMQKAPGASPLRTLGQCCPGHACGHCVGYSARLHTHGRASVLTQAKAARAEAAGDRAAGPAGVAAGG